MSSRADDLNIRQNQTPHFALFRFDSLPTRGRGKLLIVRVFTAGGQSTVPLLSFSEKLQGRGGGGKMVLSVVEAEPASGKPPAGVNVRISTGERRDFGASAPSLTRASSLDLVKSGSSAKLPKLVKLVGSSLTRADEISPYFSLIIYCGALYAHESLHLDLRLPSRRDVAAESHAAVLLDATFS